VITVDALIEIPMEVEEDGRYLEQQEEGGIVLQEG